MTTMILNGSQSQVTWVTVPKVLTLGCSFCHTYTSVIFVNENENGENRENNEFVNKN